MAQCGHVPDRYPLSSSYPKSLLADTAPLNLLKCPPCSVLSRYLPQLYPAVVSTADPCVPILIVAEHGSSPPEYAG